MESLLRGYDIHILPTRKLDVYGLPKHEAAQFERCYCASCTVPIPQIFLVTL